LVPVSDTLPFDEGECCCASNCLILQTWLLKCATAKRVQALLQSHTNGVMAGNVVSCEHARRGSDKTAGLCIFGLSRLDFEPFAWLCLLEEVSRQETLYIMCLHGTEVCTATGRLRSTSDLRFACERSSTRGGGVSRMAKRQGMRPGVGAWPCKRDAITSRQDRVD
jgi:hypothetical protein